MAIVERKLIGGTCVNVGCIPTKALVASARAAHMARRGPDFGVQLDGPVRVDMKRVKARGLGVGWLDYDLKVQSLMDGESLRTDNYLLFAFPTLRAMGNIDRFQLGLLANGAFWDYDGEELSYYDGGSYNY